MPRILLLHLRNHLLRHVKEAGDVRIHHQIVVFFGVVGERLRNEDSGIIDQQINTVEKLEGCIHHAGAGGEASGFEKRLELRSIAAGAAPRYP